MSALVLAALLLIGLCSPVTSQTHEFIIGPISYPSFPDFPTYYVFDPSAGSPSPLSIRCEVVDGETFPEWTSDNPIVPLITNGPPLSVNISDQTIDITLTNPPLVLTFSPTFVPELNGTYTCDTDHSLVLTTENPFLRVNQTRIGLRLPETLLSLRVIGFFTVENGTTQMAGQSDYQLTFQDLSDSTVVLTVIGAQSSAEPNERIYTFQAAQPFSQLINPSGTTFTLTLSNGVSSAEHNFDVTIEDLPNLPAMIILEEGSPLFIDCTPIDQTTMVMFTVNSVPPSGAIITDFNLTILETSLLDSGTYACSAFGIMRETEVIIIPDEVVISMNGDFLPNDHVVNEFIDVPSFSVEFVCYGTDGNGQLSWFAEEANGLLDPLKGQTGVFPLKVNGANVTVIYSGNVARLFISELRQYSDTFKCFSEESGLFRMVTATAENPYLEVHPSTLESILLGQRLEVVFILAPALNIEAFDDIMLLLNNMTISSFTLLIDSDNPQLLRYSEFVNELQDVGNYTLIHIPSSERVTATITLIVPELSIMPTRTTVEEGNFLQISCIPSFSETRLDWEFMRLGSSNSFLLTGEVQDPRFSFSPPDTQHTLMLDMTTRDDEGSFICRVAEDFTEIVRPGIINVTVIRRCGESYSAGVVWGPTLANRTASIACSQADSRLSGQMTRECFSFGLWSNVVDFSNCMFLPTTDSTQQCPEIPPDSILLVWMQLEANDVQQVENSRIRLQSELSGNVSVVTGTPVVFTELQVYPDVISVLGGGEGIRRRRGGRGGFSIPTVGALFAATLNESAVSININDIRSFISFGGLFRLGDFFVFSGEFERPSAAGFQPGDFCRCGQNLEDLQQLCVGTGGPVCDSGGEFNQCISDYVGNEMYCSLDSDGDGYPAVAIPCTVEESSEPYCQADTCPADANQQSNTDPCLRSGCLAEVDSSYGIPWQFTDAGMTACERCSGNSTGYATRMCDTEGNWMQPNAMDCANRAFEDLLRRAQNLTDEATAFAVVDDLVIATQMETSLFPQDINDTITSLTNVIDFLSMTLDQTGMADANETEPFVDVLNNVLNANNLAGFQGLQELGTGAQTLLNTAEVIGGYIARAVGSDDTVDEIKISRDNIALRARTYDALQDVTFPNNDDLLNFTSLSTTGDFPAQIIIPAELLEERINQSSSPEVAVANIIFQNLEDFLPLLYTNGSRPRSFVISSQVDAQSGINLFSPALQQNPVILSFSTTLDQNDTSPRCAFWNFSDPVGTGGWSIGGVTTDSVTTGGNNTVVQCSSTHLTSFAVLVDVGGLQIDSLALQIVSYIGIGISLFCLLLTILFFLAFGKKLFIAVHNFIHLNLAIALFLGYLTFAVGIELAADSEGACKVVAALLHYFFLASFSWMLCEGIMLYLMLVLVFSKLSKKWWFFLLFGWCLPLPFLAIGLAALRDGYGVKDSDNSFQYCWLSSKKGMDAIWTFVAPMLAIILVNTVILIMVLVKVYKNKGARKEQMMEEGKRVELALTIIKASVILLPLLGLTWVFGLFAVNENTLVFAWLFTICNSLQGLFIFIFHVLRSEKVWGRLKEKTKKYTVSHSKSGSEGTGSTAASRAKSSKVTSAYSSGIPLSEVKVKHDSSIAPGPTLLYPDDTIKKPLDQETAVTPLAYAELDQLAEIEKEDLGGTVTFKGLDTPPIETKAKPQRALRSVSPEGNTVPEEDPEYTLSLKKQQSADDYGQDNQPGQIEPPAPFDPNVTITLDVQLEPDTQQSVEEGTPAVVSLYTEDEQGMPHQFERPDAALLGATFDRSNITVRRKAFGTELLHKRNEKLRARIESLLGVSLENKEGGPEVVSDDVLLCKLVNKLHPGLITTIHDPDQDDVLSGEKHIQNVAGFIAACKKLNVPQEKMCSAGDIIDGRNQHLVIACLEHLLQSST